MKTQYNKFSYRGAKEFLKDAKVLLFESTPTYRLTSYLKPDGNKWFEREITLDGVEWDYSLTFLGTVSNNCTKCGEDINYCVCNKEN